MLFSASLTVVLVALFLSSVGRGRRDHVVVVGILALLSLLWLVASITAMAGSA